MEFDTFIETAWNDHAAQPQDVADRLAAQSLVIASAQQILPLATLITHVYGEHLGRWNDGMEVLRLLRGSTFFDGSVALAGVLDRGIATLRCAGGDPQALEGLAEADRVAVLASASSALAGRNDFDAAIESYSRALRLADAGLEASSPVNRALAVGGNNLAASLEQKPARDATETQAMVVAAKSALRYWKIAGTWLEEERAEYRLARSLLAAGDSSAGLRSARRCDEICSRNNAPPLEHFFAATVTAAAQRAGRVPAAFAASRDKALAIFAELPETEKAWCEAEINELRA